MVDANGLTPMALLFVDEFMIDRKPSAAMRRVLNDPKATNVQQRAQDFLRRPTVKAEIERRMVVSAQRARKTLDDVIAEQERIAFANIEDFIEIDEHGQPHIDFSKVQALPEAERRDKMAAIAEVGVEAIGDLILKTRFKMHSKSEALRELRAQLGGPSAERGGMTTINNTLIIADPGEAAKQYARLMEGKS